MKRLLTRWVRGSSLRWRAISPATKLAGPPVYADSPAGGKLSVSRDADRGAEPTIEVGLGPQFGIANGGPTG